MMTLTAGDGTVHPQGLPQPAIQAQQRRAQCRPLNFQPHQWTVMGLRVVAYNHPRLARNSKVRAPVAA